MIPAEIQDVFDKVINPYLETHGGIAYPLSYENRILTIRMGGACRGCLMLDTTLNGYIKKELDKNCKKYVIRSVEVSDAVDPELWAMAQQILNGGKK